MFSECIYCSTLALSVLPSNYIQITDFKKKKKNKKNPFNAGVRKYLDTFEIKEYATHETLLSTPRMPM